MAKTEKVIAKLAKRLHECLSEEGVDPEIELSEHEGTVAARIDVDGETVRIVAQVWDRDVLPFAHGSPPHDQVRARLLSAALRPTLEQRAAAGAEEPRTLGADADSENGVGTDR